MNIEQIKEILYKYYGVDDTDADLGGTLNGKWLSIEKILEILEEEENE